MLVVYQQLLAITILEYIYYVLFLSLWLIIL